MKTLFILLLVAPLISYAEVIKPTDKLCLSWNKHPGQKNDSTFKYKAYYFVGGKTNRFWIGSSVETCFIASKFMDLTKANHCFAVKAKNEFGNSPMSDKVCILSKAGEAPQGKVTGTKIRNKGR